MPDTPTPTAPAPTFSPGGILQEQPRQWTPPKHNFRNVADPLSRDAGGDALGGPHTNETRLIDLARASGVSEEKIREAATRDGIAIEAPEVVTPEQRRHDAAHGVETDPSRYDLAGLRPPGLAFEQRAEFDADARDFLAAGAFHPGMGRGLVQEVLNEQAIFAKVPDAERAAYTEKQREAIKKFYGGDFDRVVKNLDLLISNGMAGRENGAFYKMLTESTARSPYVFARLAGWSDHMSAWSKGRPQ
jgi:hypothetical protein